MEFKDFDLLNASFLIKLLPHNENFEREIHVRYLFIDENKLHYLISVNDFAM